MRYMCAHGNMMLTNGRCGVYACAILVLAISFGYPVWGLSNYEGYGNVRRLRSVEDRRGHSGLWHGTSSFEVKGNPIHLSTGGMEDMNGKNGRILAASDINRKNGGILDDINDPAEKNELHMVTEKHHMSRKLQGACVPQQYPKQGALLPVSMPSLILDIIWPNSIDELSESQSNPAADEFKIVYALMTDLDGFYGGPIWRSDYHGKADSWLDLTPKLQSVLPKEEDSKSAGVVNVHWHPSKPEKVFLQGRGRYHFVSDDNGATFSAVSSPGNTVGYSQEAKVHPKRPDWILIKALRDSCSWDFFSPECTADLWISKDFGHSWKNLTEASKGKITGFNDFEWGAKLPMFAGKETPDEAIYATVYLGETHRGAFPGWDKDLHYIVSLDLFETDFAKVIPCGNLFEVIAGKVYLAVPSECPVGPDGSKRKPSDKTIDSRTVTLYVSDGDGDDFVEACLPASLEDDGYNIVRSHDKKAAVILADHAEPGSFGPQTDSPTSDMYTPAYNASLHTLSLPDIYRRDFIVDLTRIEELPGAFLVNQLDPAAKGPGSRGREASFLRSRLSLDGGSSWQSLSPPENFRYGVCNSCSQGATPDQCKLHVHGPSSWLAPEGPHPSLYSLEAAPGLLIATGNLGPHLDFSPDADCTWLSRDGGFTWEDIADRTAIYEVGNSGAIVIMAAHRSEGPTNKVLFSIDQGACFHTVNLPEAILVDNIRTAPGNRDHVFLVHGVACLKTDEHPDCSFTGGKSQGGRLYSIDIQDLLGSDWKECGTSAGSNDLEELQLPNDNTCLLGAKRKIRQKTREAFCFYPKDYNPKLEMTETCKCTIKDTECEFGFVRDKENCIPLTQLDTQEACPRLTTSDYRISSTHMRLVHGDVCHDINEIIHDTNGKGGKKGSSESGGDGKKKSPTDSHHSIVRTFFIFIIAGGALSIGGGLLWTRYISTDMKENIVAKLASVLGLLGPILEMVLGKVVEVYDWCRRHVRSLILRLTGREDASSYFDNVTGYEPLQTSDGVGLGRLPEEDLRSPSLGI